MPTEMTDKALIAAIAKKFGWKKRIPDTRFPDMCVWFFEGTAYESHKLPSTDQCLALTGEPEGLELWKDSTGWNCSYPTGEKTGTFAHGEPNRPRAILRALLEVE